MAGANHDKGGAFATSRRGGMDSWEVSFIDAKREQGVSDFSIAAMIGRPFASVRAVPREILQVTVVEAEPARAKPKPLMRLEGPAAVAKKSRKSRPRSMPPRVRALVSDIAAKHELTLEDLVGPSQRQLSAIARHEAFAMIREYRDCFGKAHYSLQLIGSWFGGRDHTTIRSGVMGHWARVANEQLEWAA